MNTPTPRTSSAIIASGFQAVPEGFRAFAGILERELVALTAERDRLRADNSTLRAAQKACEACDEPTAFEVRQLRARAERAEAEVERLRAGIGECLRANAHLADGEDCTLIGLKRRLRNPTAARESKGGAA